jgi:PrlF antitoxin of toxin-antitoxin system YhaV/PrlF
VPILNRKRNAGTRRETIAETEYRGKQTRTGNSLGFRFEGALFKSHPEFNGEVRAQIIAPGRLLVMAEPEGRANADPVMASFLAFLAQDMAHSPHKIQPLGTARKRRMAQLTKGIAVDLNEDIGKEAIL